MTKPQLTYAGIGARATPRPVLRDMTTLASWLARQGWHLASGGADGADTAFAAGTACGERTIYLPWPRYKGLEGPDCCVLTDSERRECVKLAASLHPAWDRCSRTVRSLHARNAAIVLGARLDQPVAAVICWTPAGRITGGTGMALRLAADRGIEILNLASITPRVACERMLEIAAGATRPSCSTAPPGP